MNLREALWFFSNYSVVCAIRGLDIPPISLIAALSSRGAERATRVTNVKWMNDGGEREAEAEAGGLLNGDNGKPGITERDGGKKHTQ